MSAKKASHGSQGRSVICASLWLTAFFAAAAVFGQGIVISPTTLPNGTVGAAYSQTLSATGGLGFYFWTVSSGTLPTGLMLGPPTFGTSVTISGTPSAPGSFTFTITATDDLSNSGSRTYTVVISCAAVIALSPASLPNGTVGGPYSRTITASGGLGPYMFSITSGSPPAGLTLSAGGVLSGTPTTVGVSSFTVTATDANNCTGSRAYTVAICGAITISPSSLPAATVGAAYSQMLMASGGTSPYAFTVVSGSLPPGLTLSASGLISGTPTVGGTFSFTVSAVDATGCPGSMSYSISVGTTCVPPPAPTLSATPVSVTPGQAITLMWNQTILPSQGNYTVQVSVDGSDYFSAGTVSSSSSPTVTFTYLSGAVVRYDFRVQATSSCGSSSTSNVVTVLVTSACPPRLQVTGVTVRPTSAIPGSSFTLSWNPVVNYNGSYGVFRSTDGGKNFQLLASTANTSYTGTVTDVPGTTITFEVEILANCSIYPVRSASVDLTVVATGPCTAPGPVSNIQVRAAGLDRAPAPTEYIFVSWNTPSPTTTQTRNRASDLSTAPSRYGVRINGEMEVSSASTSVTLPPRGSKLDPIQATVKGYACTPEVSGEERSSAPVALFLTPPNANFVFSSNPRAGVPVVFTDASSPQATSYLWVFDDQTTDLRQSPAHVFSTPGPHLIYLFASNGAGSSQASQTVMVSAASASILPPARVIPIDITEPGRRRAHIRIEGPESVKLTIRPNGESEAVVFLRFRRATDEPGEAVLERRLVVEPGSQGIYDLAAYGLTGEWEIELVGSGQYEPTLTTTSKPHARQVER